jgi:hypothetical protein
MRSTTAATAVARTKNDFQAGGESRTRRHPCKFFLRMVRESNSKCRFYESRKKQPRKKTPWAQPQEIDGPWDFTAYEQGSRDGIHSQCLDGSIERIVTGLSHGAISDHRNFFQLSASRRSGCPGSRPHRSGLRPGSRYAIRCLGRRQYHLRYGRCDSGRAKMV